MITPRMNKKQTKARVRMSNPHSNSFNRKTVENYISAISHASQRMSVFSRELVKFPQSDHLDEHNL